MAMNFLEIDNTKWIELNSCPACGSDQRTFWKQDKNRREGLPIKCDAWSCSECGSIYLSPLPSSESVHSLYSESHSSPPSQSFLGRNADRVVDTWARLWAPSLKMRGEPRDVGAGRDLLSIGCGYASGLKKYHSLGWNIHGIDSDMNAIQWNEKNLPGQYIYGTFEDHVFDKSFDLIHCSAVLEHIYDPLGFVSKARDLLRPGGKLLFFTPNAGGFMTQTLKNHSIAFWVPFHLILFTPTGLRMLANRAGLDATVKTISEPHLASLSIRQWRSRNRSYFTLQKGWDTRASTVFTAPLWSILNRFERGEELALFAELPK